MGLNFATAGEVYKEIVTELSKPGIAFMHESHKKKNRSFHLMILVAKTVCCWWWCLFIYLFVYYETRVT